jgi:hypothetical protein
MAYHGMKDARHERRGSQGKTRKRLPRCPECGSHHVVPIVHGIPTPTLQKAIDEGRAILADREEWEGMTEWYCKDCGCDWSGGWRRFKKPAK